VKKNFPKEERQEMESWREMFERCSLGANYGANYSCLRCTEERKDKLERLKGKVKASYLKEKTGQKKAKLAYVGLNAKPPRQVRNAQMRNGVSAPTGQPMRRPAAAPVVAPNPHKKPKVAPMMAKTLRMARGMKTGFRR